MIAPRPSLFVSYSHLDEGWKDRVVSHLRVLEADGHIDLWDDRRIMPGADWRAEIDAALAGAGVALLLVSTHSLTSPFILGEEVPALLRRRAGAGLRVIPVLLRPCAWQEVTWLKALKMVPEDARALSSLPEHEADTALAALARDVRRSLRADPAQAATASPAIAPPILDAPRAAALAAPPPGDPLAGYEVLKEVHVGHYGRVLKCRRDDGGEICIVKATDASHASQQVLTVLSELRCPNVAAPSRIWQADDMLYEELPYVGGLPLQQLVTPGFGGLDGALLESFHRQVDETLRVLHRAGIIHRDIHPANVYAVLRSPEQMQQMQPDDVESSWTFDAFGRGSGAFLLAWVVVDCTFAVLASDLSQSGYRHGPFTPPEQEDGAATTASDMYAFGATMYHGISGDDPPSAQNRRFDPRVQLHVPETSHPATDFERYLERLQSLDAAERPPAGYRHRLRPGSIAARYCATVGFDDAGIVIVDTFPSETRLVPRNQALREVRALYRQFDEGSAWRAELAYWIERLSGDPPIARV